MLKTYDPKLVAIIVNGRQLSGFADGTFVAVERAEDGWQLTVGADGEGARAKSNNKSGTVTVTLMATSDANRILSDLALADELSNGGVFAMMVKDNSGNDLHAAEQAYVKKFAPAEYARENGTREWVIETDNLQTFMGGN